MHLYMNPNYFEKCNLKASLFQLYLNLTFHHMDTIYIWCTGKFPLHQWLYDTMIGKLFYLVNTLLLNAREIHPTAHIFQVLNFQNCFVLWYNVWQCRLPVDSSCSPTIIEGLYGPTRPMHCLTINNGNLYVQISSVQLEIEWIENAVTDVNRVLIYNCQGPPTTYLMCEIPYICACWMVGRCLSDIC